MLLADVKRILKRSEGTGKGMPIAKRLIESLAATLGAYQLLAEQGPMKLSEVAVELGYKSSKKLKDDIREVQENGTEVIKLGQTVAKSAAIESPEALQQVKTHEELLKKLAQFVGDPVRPLIKIACGHALTYYFIPQALKRLREMVREAGSELTNEDFDVEIIDSNSTAVSHRIENSEVDFGITSFEPSESDKHEFVEWRELEVKVLFDRRHERLKGVASREITEELKQPLFHNMRMAIQDHSTKRPTNYTFNTSLLPEGTEFVKVDSWAAAMAMTLSGGNVCCTAPTNFFSPQTRCQFREFSLPNTTKMCFGVRRCKRNGDALAPSHLMDLATKAIQDEVARFMQQEPVEVFSDSTVFDNDEVWTAHSTINPKTNKPCWMLGRMDRIVTAPDGTMQCDHRLFKHWETSWENRNTENSMALTLDGFVIKDMKTTHMVWTGKQDDGPKAETYATELVHDPQDWKTGNTAHSIGVWSGRKVWSRGVPNRGIGKPFIGWFVVLSKDALVLTEQTLSAALAAEIRTAIKSGRVFNPEEALVFPEA